MSTPETTDPGSDREIFDDPVAYLARCGIEAELITETPLPLAA